MEGKKQLSENIFYFQIIWNLSIEYICFLQMDACYSSLSIDILPA